MAKNYFVHEMTISVMIFVTVSEKIRSPVFEEYIFSKKILLYCRASLCVYKDFSYRCQGSLGSVVLSSTVLSANQWNDIEVTDKSKQTRKQMKLFPLPAPVCLQ